MLAQGRRIELPEAVALCQILYLDDGARHGGSAE
jgi:hypothetical protein